MTPKERELVEEIEALVNQLPGGIDAEADEGNSSPEDAVAHIGGLIAQRLRRLLGP